MQYRLNEAHEFPLVAGRRLEPSKLTLADLLAVRAQGQKARALAAGAAWRRIVGAIAARRQGLAQSTLRAA